MRGRDAGQRCSCAPPAAGTEVWGHSPGVGGSALGVPQTPGPLLGAGPSCPTGGNLARGKEEGEPRQCPAPPGGARCKNARVAEPGRECRLPGPVPVLYPLTEPWAVQICPRALSVTVGSSDSPSLTPLRPWPLSQRCFSRQFHPRLSRSCTRAALPSLPRLPGARSEGSPARASSRLRERPNPFRRSSGMAVPHPGALDISRRGPPCPRQAQPPRLFIPSLPPTHPALPAQLQRQRIPAGTGIGQPLPGMAPS